MRSEQCNASVCAVLGGTAQPLRTAVEAQTTPPGAVVGGEQGLEAALRRALETGAEWLWVLDGSAVPRPAALGALLEALGRVHELADPVLLAGVVLDPDGRVDPGRAAWYRRGHPEPAMAAAERRLLPIRATAGPVLVRRGAVEAELPRAGTPFAAGAVLEWTATVLRRPAGYLVPDSEYVATASEGDPALDRGVAARLVAGRAFSGADRLRVGFELAERALRRARSRAF
jgi:hypothetical protein